MSKNVKSIVSDAFSKVPKVPFYSISEKGRLIFQSGIFIKYLENYGYRTIKVGGTIELVQIKGCIVSKITPSDIKQFIKIQTDGEGEIHKYILDRTALFNINFLDALERANLKMHRDTAISSYHYFKNGVVEVTKDGIKTPIPYNQFKRLIWEEHIIQRDFEPSTDIANKIPVFLDFLNKLTNNQPERLKSLCTVIGYCLHDYRTTANAKSIIINDEIVSDQPEGGSGKSLLVIAMGKIRKMLEIDGKKFDPKHEFAWQNVNESIRIVNIDDAARGFQFENLFSAITQGFAINRKNKEQYFLPIEDAPLLILTTNVILKGCSGSFIRRQYSIDIHQYFNANLTPRDEYKHDFFSGWNKREWAKFDMFMMQCISMYLKYGVITCPESDNKKKDAIRATSITFVEWFEEIVNDYEIDSTPTNAARLQYLDASGQRNLKLSDKRFSSWVQSYCKIYGHKYIKCDTQRPRGFRIELNK
ncbi:MAG: hypothetical protein PF517_21400 [Salinivirgaceae bacterium]|jgi:hypothetical protein|nr:hypothetical protein [Salinivirgaceae bacterium]